LYNQVMVDLKTPNKIEEIKAKVLTEEHRALQWIHGHAWR